MRTNFFDSLFPGTPCPPPVAASLTLSKPDSKLRTSITAKQAGIAINGIEPPAKPPTTSNMKIYRIAVNGKPITVLDPTGMQVDDMKRILTTKFGDRLDEIGY